MPQTPVTASPATSNASTAENANKQEALVVTNNIKTDSHGLKYYGQPLPGFEKNRSYPYWVYQPHIPYMYFSSVQENKSGGKVVYINLAEGSGRPRIQLCGFHEEPMTAPFGASEPRNKQGQIIGDGNTLNIQFSISTDQQLAFIRSIDARILEMAHSRYGEWFSTDEIPDPLVIKQLFKKGFYPLVNTDKPKQQKDKNQPLQKKEYRPMTKAKLTVSGPGAAKIYMKMQVETTGKWKLQEVDISYIKDVRFVKCIPIVDLAGIWFMGGSDFGASFRLKDIIVIPEPPEVEADFQGAEIEIVKPGSIPIPSTPSSTSTTGTVPVPSSSFNDLDGVNLSPDEAALMGECPDDCMP